VALTLVGTAPIDSTPRYTFGSTSLQAGFGTLPFLIAIFAMVAILDIAHQDPKSLKRDIGEVHAEGGKLTVGEMLGQTWNLLRSSVIGSASGFCPASGPARPISSPI
jgi:putative tricarboxylic transport membrane protein